MKKGGTRRSCGRGLGVSRGGARTTGPGDNLKSRLAGEGAGPKAPADLEGGVLGKGTGLSPRLWRMRTTDR